VTDIIIFKNDEGTYIRPLSERGATWVNDVLRIYDWQRSFDGWLPLFGDVESVLGAMAAAGLARQFWTSMRPLSFGE
jgi:hypothetical protein